MAEVWAGKAIARVLTIRKMKKLKATDEENAKKPEELHIHKSFLEELEKLKRVKRTKDGRYYVVCKDEKHC